MANAGTRPWIGYVAVVLGVLLLLMLSFEIKDGTLYGSKSNGMTIESNPITFYMSTIIQGLIVLLLILGGISIVRSKS